MAHLSENARPLTISKLSIGLDVINIQSQIQIKDVAVWFFICPTDSNFLGFSVQLLKNLETFATLVSDKAIVAILTTPCDAAEICPVLEKHLKFQLWVAVKTSIQKCAQSLSNNHAALLIFSKYKQSLLHTKTRIAYTYCPVCDKTTKDYGGKKHTYHNSGTLMSDVWRDIEYVPDEYPDVIVERLRDVFGTLEYNTLYAIDLRHNFKKQDNLIYKQSEVAWNKESNPLVPKYIDNLFNGDCLEILRNLPSNSMDFCFADPPYNLNKRYDSSQDNLDIIRYFEWCDAWLYELARVLKPGRTLAVLNIPLWSIRHFSYLKTILSFQYWIVWEGLSLPVRMIMPAHYSIVCFSKGIARPLPGFTRSTHSQLESESLCALKELFCLRQSCIKKREYKGILDKCEITNLWWDIHRLKHNTYRVDHPCQLPPALMRRLISLFTYKDEIVLDPFNGAGTTTLTAQQLNRRYMGIELSEKYFNLALKRHQELNTGLDPFRKLQGIPSAKNSYVERLKPQKYAVPKKALQLEIKRIAQELGHLPSREEVAVFSKYPMNYYDEYFISWAEVCAAARTTGMTENKRDSELSLEEKFPLFRFA